MPATIARFFAHSLDTPDTSRWQTLREHLEAVADEAARNAARFGAADWGHAAGLLHDIGKYSSAFQARLSGDPSRVDHATAGAQEACRRYGKLPSRPLQFAVAGHHAGLADGDGEGNGRTPLEERLKRAVDDYVAFTAEIVLPERLAPPPLSFRRDRCGFQLALFTRMLLGCLVDADHRDTAAFYDAIEGIPTPPPKIVDMAALAAQLDQHLAHKSANAEATTVNQIRARVLAACRERAEDPQGIFTLTVPTGGGKTLSSLAFALRHAVRHGLDRVLYVAPFTSIIEQTASVFRDGLGDDAVLEHHTAFDEDVLDKQARDKLLHVTPSWEAPIVVTTAVQFFESLFTDRPGRARKLPAIARAVIVLDEAQTLPLPLLRPCVAALDELARNYHSTIVLCTATQPTLGEAQGFAGGLPAATEIAPEPARLYEELRRVRVPPEVAELNLAGLASRLQAREQVLCIVDTRRQAHDLALLLGENEAHVHLSLNLCAQHRSLKLQAVRRRLEAGLPCRVVATSLVEAGVDVDFPCIFRAETGLDQLAQAAGRCNRNGKRAAEDSIVQVFRLEGAKLRGSWDRRVKVARGVLRRHEDPLGLDAVAAFFRQLYGTEGDRALDTKNILANSEHGVGKGLLRFAEIASLFRMIEDGQQAVIVPFDDVAKDALRTLRHAPCPPRDVMRRLQRRTVSLRDGSFRALLTAGAVQPVGTHDDIFELVSTQLYDDYLGLTSDDPTFREADDNVV